MCPRCCFKEIIPSLELKYPACHSSEFKLFYTFESKTFIELVVYVKEPRRETNYSTKYHLKVLPEK